MIPNYLIEYLNCHGPKKKENGKITSKIGYSRPFLQNSEVEHLVFDMDV